MKNLLIIQMLAGIFLFACGQSTPAPADTQTRQPAVVTSAKDTTAVTATVYACPMHPQIKGKAGDHCSICKMELKPVNK